MSKSKSNTVNTQARSSVVNAYVQALTAQATTGNLIAVVCAAVSKAFKSGLTESDRDSIVADIAAAKGWEGSSANTRKSEVKTVLNAHAKLPEAIAAYSAANNGKCQWHDGMKLARRLAGGESVTDAVAAMLNTEERVSDPTKRVLSALKLLVKANPAKGAQAQAAAKLLGLELKLSTPKAEKIANPAIMSSMDAKAQLAALAKQLGVTIQ